MRMLVLVGAVVAASFMLAGVANAKTVPVSGHNPAQVAKKCGGGVFFPPGGKGGAYGCLNADGSGIICGGVTPAQKKNCTQWAIAPPGTPYAQQLKEAVARAH
jgi:hypothetical protein